MRGFVLTAALAALLVPTAARAVVSCSDLIPPAVPAPQAAGVTCQQTITKEAAKFALVRAAVLSKCMQRQVPGLCPQAKDTTRIEKAAQKAQLKIGKKCDDDAAQAGLSTSYGQLSDAAVIGACTLSQHTATTEIVLGINNGTPGRIVASKARDKCAKELSKQGLKYLKGALGAMNGCFSRAVKQAAAGEDLALDCMPSWQSGTFTPPVDQKAAKAFDKLERKAESAIAKKCGGLPEDDVIGDEAVITPTIESLFACPGARTVADLQACIVCENQRAAARLFLQENAESFQALVAPGASIQTAVDAASDDEKIMILPGTYAESVIIGTHGLSLVGCGSATGDRPRIVPPAKGAAPNGITAAGVDGLLFQGLEVFDWDENGIFVTGATGVTFRDILGDGNRNSVYAIYPVESTNVLVEGCEARNIADAGIYVGQDVDVVVRYNRALQNVAGIEIENSANALVYGNYAAGNTGGLLVFKLPGPALQVSQDHEVFANVSVDNNEPNFGNPNAAVGVIPDGTGMLILSNDTTDFHHNIMQGNDTFGLAVIDQQIVNTLAGDPVFNPTSADQKTEANLFRTNLVTGNGTSADSTPPNDVPFGANIVYLLGEPADNCFMNNVTDVTLGGGGAPDVGVSSDGCP